MYYAKESLAHLHRFVQTLAADQYRPVQKFLVDLLYGLITSGSVLLAQIARQLEPGKDLLILEKRLSRHLASPRWKETQLQQTYLDEVAAQIQPETVLALDLGDLTKKYARQMEHLCEVWDGSEKEVTTGYWLLEVEAHQANGRRLGLWLEAWSQQAEGFESRNREILRVVRIVSHAVGRRGIWVLDRGGDAQALMQPLDELGVQYLIRQTGERHIQANPRGKPETVQALARRVRECGRLTLRHRLPTGRWQTKTLRYGFQPICWPKTQRVYTLVVVRSRSEEPWWLWTNCSVATAGQAEWIVRAYLRRWAVEDAGRVVKQEFGLEQIRVQSWRAIRRLVILVGLAYGFVCQLGQRGPRVLAWLSGLVRAFRAPRKVWAYRLRQGLAALWKAGSYSLSPNSG